MIITNKSVRDWTELLAGDEVLTTAILDRLLHRSHLLSIRGRSYPLRDLEDALKPPLVAQNRGHSEMPIISIKMDQFASQFLQKHIYMWKGWYWSPPARLGIRMGSYRR